MSSGDILSMVIGINFLLCIVALIILLIIFGTKYYRAKRDFINSLDEHDKSVICAYNHVVFDSEEAKEKIK